MAPRRLLRRDCLAVTSIFQRPQLIGFPAPGAGPHRRRKRRRVPVLRWRGGSGLAAAGSAGAPRQGWSRPWALTPPAVLQVSASPRPRCCPPALPPGLFWRPCGAGTASQLPGPRAVRGNGPGRASPLAPGFAARPSPPRLPAVPPGTGSAARPGKVGPPRAPPEACGAVNLRGSWGPSALPSTPVRAGTATPGTPYGAPVLPVAPGFSWSPTAQRETFGPGLVYSSSAFNACSILNGGTCKKFTSFLYNKLIIE